MSVDAQKIRDEIQRMYDQLTELTFYELLGVEKDVESDAITASFRQLAKKWHVDRFSQIELNDDERSKVQAIFSAINEAHRTLTNVAKREDYDFEESDGPNVADILTAENFFLRGKNMFKTGGNRGAHELFKAAHEANPEEGEYKAYYLYTEYLQISKDENGRVANKTRSTAILKELEEIQTHVKEKDWMMSFMGTIHLGLSNERQALSFFREATYLNPNNHDAKRQLRLLESRKTTTKSGGFLARFFGKK
jgi:curved DNA-binding protein CbpA